MPVSSLLLTNWLSLYHTFVKKSNKKERSFSEGCKNNLVKSFYNASFFVKMHSSSSFFFQNQAN